MSAKVADNSKLPLMAGNWKMNCNHLEAIALVQKLAFTLTPRDYTFVEVVVLPPFTDLRSVQTVISADDLPFALGAQHCHWEDKGAYTGEVSPVFLAKLEVQFVICGHSERRELFGETDEMVNAKVRAIHRHGMTPIMCVGETLAEREAGATQAKVLGQLAAGLTGLTKDQVATTVVAYEPIWAIGTGRTATAADAQAVCAAIRAQVAELVDRAAADTLRIQYGGSVKGANIDELMAEADIDGALVGGASLDPEEFARIAHFK